VRLQPINRHQKEWRPAIVATRLSTRTYEVQTPDGRTLRRNRQLIRPSRTAGTIRNETDITATWNRSTTNNHAEHALSEKSANTTELNDHRLDKPELCAPMPLKPPDIQQNAEHNTTRSGRVSKPPDRLNL
jgi:hypothetical protein